MLSNITIHITTFCISKFQMESGIKSMVHCGNSNIKTMEKNRKQTQKHLVRYLDQTTLSFIPDFTEQHILKNMCFQKNLRCFLVQLEVWLCLLSHWRYPCWQCLYIPSTPHHTTAARCRLVCYFKCVFDRCSEIFRDHNNNSPFSVLNKHLREKNSGELWVWCVLDLEIYCKLLYSEALKTREYLKR